VSDSRKLAMRSRNSRTPTLMVAMNKILNFKCTHRCTHWQAKLPNTEDSSAAGCELSTVDLSLRRVRGIRVRPQNAAATNSSGHGTQNTGHALSEAQTRHCP